MNRPAIRFARALSFAALIGLTSIGCNIDVGDIDVGDLLAELDVELNNSVDDIQTVDPREIELPPPIVNRGDTIIIEQEVEVIVNIQEQLVIEELPDITLLGLENLTGFDIYLTYFANGVLQEVFIFNGETLLLEYSCLDAVELSFEEDYDVFGLFVQSFELEAIYFNPEDFFCGEALIITIDPFGVSASIDIVDLAR